MQYKNAHIRNVRITICSLAAGVQTPIGEFGAGAGAGVGAGAGGGGGQGGPPQRGGQNNGR